MALASTWQNEFTNYFIIKMAIQFNIPTNLTLLRIALIPLLAVVFYVPWQYANIACTFIFFLAGVTDWLDGYLARKLNMETPFGAFLDPVADKLMVAFVLVLLVQQQSTPYLAIPAAIIIGREITIASLRETRSPEISSPPLIVTFFTIIGGVVKVDLSQPPRMARVGI